MATLQLNRLTDGEHLLEIFSTDANGLPEVVPQSRSFVVDTAPPTVSITLLSPSPSQANFATLLLACVDDLSAAGCVLQYTPRVYPVATLPTYEEGSPVTLLPGNLTANHSVILSVPFNLLNGGLDVVVTATDGAGNAVPSDGAAVSPLWVRDTLPPDTAVTFAGTSTGVFVGGSVNATIINSTTIDLIVSSPSEPVVGFNVSVASSVNSTWSMHTTGGGVISVNLSFDGVVTISTVGFLGDVRKLNTFTHHAALLPKAKLY
jgi:hypothetical protein